MRLDEFAAVKMFPTGMRSSVFGATGNGANMKLKSLLPIGLAGALAFGSAAGEPRGIKNNNPGNIRKSSIQWKGAVGDDGAFVKFSSPEDGIRAMARILRVYDSKYKINTIRGIVNRWAPPSENDTGAYIDFVSKKLGKKPDEPLSIGSDADLAKLITVIIEREIGKVPYDDETILRGVKKS